jgi:hypothetical protein
VVRRLVEAELLIRVQTQYSHQSHQPVAVEAVAMMATVLTVALAVEADTGVRVPRERAVVVTSHRQTPHKAMTVDRDRLLRVTPMVAAVAVLEPLVKLLLETMAVTVVMA